MSHDDYERYMNEFATRLVAAAQTERPRRAWLGRGPTRSPWVLSVGAAAAAAVTVAVVLLVGGRAGTPALDAVAEARAALAPSGRIVHMRITVRTSAAQTIRQEIWTAASPPRWRQITDQTGRRTSLLHDGRRVRSRGRREISYGAGELRTYREQFRELTVLTGIPDSAPTARTGPAILGLRGNDPAATLRGLLDRGRLRDTGPRTDANGKHVRRLIGSVTTSSHTTEQIVYDVDPDTFAPVQGSLIYRDTRTGRSAGAGSRFVVERYETLPDTHANAALLRIAAPKNTKISVRKALLPDSK
jgi:hypothetical protein